MSRIVARLPLAVAIALTLLAIDVAPALAANRIVSTTIGNVLICWPPEGPYSPPPDDRRCVLASESAVTQICPTVDFDDSLTIEVHAHVRGSDGTEPSAPAQMTIGSASATASYIGRGHLAQFTLKRGSFDVQIAFSGSVEGSGKDTVTYLPSSGSRQFTLGCGSENPTTKIPMFIACAPGSRPHQGSGSCYVRQFMAMPNSTVKGTNSAFVLCNTHDQPWSASTAVIGVAPWPGAEDVGDGAVTYTVTATADGSTGAKETSPVNVGLYPGLKGGYPFLVEMSLPKPGSYGLTVDYGGGTEVRDLVINGKPRRKVTVNWQPSSSGQVQIRVAECGDDPVVKRVGGKRPVLRVSVSDCLLPEFKSEIRYEWVVFGGSGSERLMPTGNMSGCAITVPEVVGGRKVSRVEVTRSTFGGARRTTRSISVSGPVCALPEDLDQVNWALMPDSVQRDIRREMLAQWRVQNPVGSAGGSAEAFRAFADRVDATLTLGPLLAEHPAYGSVQDVDVKAVWRAVREAPQELGNLPDYACLTLTSVVTDPLSAGAQGVRAALALLDGVLSGAVDTAKAGVSLAALMTYERPLSLAESLNWWTQQSPGELMAQARAAGISVSEQTAKQFIATAEQVNEAALNGDDARVARIIGDLGGRAVFDELFALGAAKALTAAGRASRPSIAKLEKALEGVGERLEPLARKVYQASEREISVRQLNELGMSDFQSQHITAIAERNDVRIGVKSNDAVGGMKVAEGEFLAKPEGLAAANSITPEDIELGVNPANRGAVYFGPVDPPKPGASTAVRERYEKRTAAYNDSRNREIMQWLQQDPKTRGDVPAGMRDAYGIRYDYGRVKDLHVTVGPDHVVRDVATGKPFGPDLDGMVILDAKTGKLADPAVVDKVEQELYPAGFQHGFTAHTRLIPEAKRHAILQAGGGLGDSPMVLFGGRGFDKPPVRGFIDYRTSDAWLQANPTYVGR